MNAVKFTPLVSAILAASVLALTGPAYAAQEQGSSIPEATKTVETDAALRDLWVGHVFWVRNVVLETLAGNAAAAAAAEKEVVANAHQIADAIEPFYSKPASDKLFTLLAGHYGAVKEYLQATVANSKAKEDAAYKNLVDNATEIATFLSGANPNLPFETLKSLLLAHGGHHIQQIQQLKAKQYAEEAQTWGAMKNHMFVIADALTGGIAKQFPDKFIAQAK
jgi:hypothetical protein